MYLDFTFGEFRLNLSITFGSMFSKMFKKRKKNKYYEGATTSADTNETNEDAFADDYNKYISDLQKNINTNVAKFEKELQASADINGLYDIPSGYKNELENFTSDVEIIDDEYEKEQLEMVKRIRG